MREYPCMNEHDPTSTQQLCTFVQSNDFSGLSLCDRCVCACNLCNHYASAILGICMSALGWHMHSNTRYVFLIVKVILSLPPNRITYAAHLFCSSVAISAQCLKVCIAVRSFVVSGMVMCDKSGKSCFWYAKRSWDQCINCKYAADDVGVHKGTKLCAACFEEATNDGHKQDSEVWGSCQHEECLQKTHTQRSNRDTKMGYATGVPVRAPPSNMHTHALPASAITDAGGSSSSGARTFQLPPPPPHRATPPVPDVHAEMQRLRDEVQTVNVRLDEMMEVLTTLRSQVDSSRTGERGWDGWYQ
jgi:hypothetical protein